MTEEDIKKLQSTGGDHLAATEKNILSNDMTKIWDYISSDRFGTKEKGGRLDFVLDNAGASRSQSESCTSTFLDVPHVRAGFELYTDFVYADWLLQSGLCSQIRFHGKVRRAPPSLALPSLLGPTYDLVSAFEAARRTAERELRARTRC